MYSIPSTFIRIAGNDRLKWLNGLVTNDLRNLDQQPYVEAFITDVKGRTLSHGLFVSHSDSIFYWSAGEEQSHALLTHWDRYIIREDVTLEDLSAKYRCVYFDGTEALPDNAISFPFGQAPGCGSLVISSIAIPLTSTTSSTHWNQQRIANRWPVFGIDYDQRNLPQEIDRDAQAISFRKGCYLGQETVARLDALGQVQKKLFTFRLLGADSVTSQAKIVCDGQEAGFITSVVSDPQSPSSQLALGYLKRAFFKDHSKLSVQNMPLQVFLAT